MNSIHYKMMYAVLLGLLLGVQVAVAQSDDVDMALGLPQKMVVESIDLKAGIMVLDGQRYRIASEDKRAVIRGPGTPLTPEQLSVGMEVMVSTDGTLPSSRNVPLIRGLWSAP
ncbi:hypothetical protein HFP89_08645 [Wenzhouxiangella sp. XN79A]|uniref:hypothetical protein n=1 Tax=Wenzhouxiangella sp. XN79A TaxID=2724193 RepID=UPI00144A50CF|nr:hypothetical protein [Wenzhouxiangella sp. XN79A]NKI35233.1 hypothetical protein [Wenzhouxiangella sp. XN79A]